MKTATTILGGFTLFLMSIGALFKTMQWPGANVALILGIGLLGFFLLLAFLANLNSASSTLAKVALAVGVIGGWIFSSGVLFKIMHWPGANVMLLYGMFPLFFIFLPTYLIGMSQNKVEIKLTTHTILVLALFGVLMIAYAGKRPSYSLMQEFCRVNNRTLESIKSSDHTRGMIYGVFENTPHTGTDSFHVFFDKYMAVRIRSNEMRGYIESIKSKLIFDADGINTSEHVAENNGIDMPDSTSLHPDMALDNYVLPTYFMLAEGIGSNSGKARELKEKIGNYKADLLTFVSIPVYLGLDIEDKFDEREGMKMSWPEYYFNNTTLAGTITTLTTLEAEIGNTETAVLLELLKESGIKNAQSQSK